MAGSTHQLVVTAHYKNGSEKDVTPMARYFSDDEGIASEERDHDIAIGLFFRDPDGRQLEAITYRSGDDPRRT